MKNLYSHFGKIVLALIFSVISICANAQGVTVTLQPDLTGLNVGDIVTIPVTLTGDNIKNFELYLDFDRNVLLDPAVGGQPATLNMKTGFYLAGQNFYFPMSPGITQKVYIDATSVPMNFVDEKIVDLVYIYNGGNTNIHIRNFPGDAAAPYSAFWDALGNNLEPYTFIDVSLSGNPNTFVTWNGSQGTNWNTPNNWTPSGVPTGTTNVIIPVVTNLPVVNEAPATPAVCNEIIINPSASVTIAAGKAFTVNTFLQNSAGNSGVVIKSNASGTGSLMTSSPVQAKVERYLTGATWHLISSPVFQEDVYVFVTNFSSLIETNGIKYGIAPYVNSGPTPNWVPYTTANLTGQGTYFTVAKGYELMLKPGGGTIYFDGFGSLATTNKTITVTAPAAPGNAWNLIGNPFSAPIKAANVDATDFLTVNASKLDVALQALYVWNGSAYTIINNLSGPTYLAVSQGFFVKAKASGTINFNAAMRTHTTAAPFYKNSENAWPIIDLKADIGDKSSKTQIYFVTGTTRELDPGYDAGMFDGTGTANSIYTHIDGSDVAFGIQSLPDNEYKKNVIPVGLNAGEGAQVTFTAETTNLPAYAQVFLQDRLTGTVTRLDTPGGSYSVTLKDASTGIGRFYLYTAPLTVGNDQLKEEVYTIIPLPKENKIRLIGTFPIGSQVSFFDMNGRNLGTSRLTNNAENEVQFAPDANGIYIVRITGGTSVLNRKITWMR